MSSIFFGEGSSPPLQARKTPSNILEKNCCQKKCSQKIAPNPLKTGVILTPKLQNTGSFTTNPFHYRVADPDGGRHKIAGKKMADKTPPPGGLAVLFLLCIVAMIACECLALRRRKSAMEKAGVAKARAQDRRIEGLNRDAVTSSL